MLWNYPALENNPIPFYGASSLKDLDSHQLLTQTAVTWYISGHVTGFLWKDATTWEVAFPENGLSGLYFSLGDVTEPPTDLPINAGFMDGSVRRHISPPAPGRTSAAVAGSGMRAGIEVHQEAGTRRLA